ncbi:hypothetical protein L1987_30999 [Smallanthus sonchifolius]|uniref:Uncharacterized protein n=1 Tax=Smallanthus sonchifolius TaxID=185202 RepID=A0ACB9I3S2_9ASTR|nr:hypothetical protein L1987_30999 [Smallanthus sonchifolius]
MLPLESADGSLVIPYGSNEVGPSGLRDLSSNGASTFASLYRQDAMVYETNGGSDSFPIISRIPNQLSASLNATAAAELPCPVKLRIWPYDLKSLVLFLKLKDVVYQYHTWANGKEQLKTK